MRKHLGGGGARMEHTLHDSRRTSRNLIDALIEMNFIVRSDFIAVVGKL